MKRLHQRIISALLSTILLTGSLSTAYAAYEQYLPQITHIQCGEKVELGEQHISFSPDSGIYFYTVPFTADDFSYSFSYADCETWYPQNWEEKNELQCDSIMLFDSITEGIYPIITKVFSSGNDTDVLAQKETGYYVDIKVLPALSVNSDITFYKTGEVVFDDEPIWKGSFGTGYEIGKYYLIVADMPSIGGVGYVDDLGDALEFECTDIPSDRYTVPKENIILQYMKCTGVDEEKKTIYMEVTQAQDAAMQVTEKPAVNTITANPTSSPVLLDGKTVSLDAYEIANNNYFKIRDLASVLSGTESQFDVTWDAANQAIQLTTGVPYTPVGGELTKGNGQSQPAKVSNAKVLLNGAILDLKVYEINGNTYFKLRDLGEALGFGVDWDSAQNAILIRTEV